MTAPSFSCVPGPPDEATGEPETLRAVFWNVLTSLMARRAGSRSLADWLALQDMQDDWRAFYAGESTSRSP